MCVGGCVYVSVTVLASTTYALKAKVRYQQKMLDAGNKINVGIELKILGSKVMTVICLPWNLYLVLMAGNRRQQVTSVLEEYHWYVKRRICNCKLHKLN